MAGVSVDAAAVKGAISLCRQSIQQFQSASGSLKQKYQSAGLSWKDGKYQQLGDVVRDCTAALDQPVKQLESCIQKLTELQKAIETYEQTKVK